MRTRQIHLVCALLICCCGNAWAGDSWSLSKLNPFKKKPAKEERSSSNFQSNFHDSATRTVGYEHPEVAGWGSRARKTVTKKEPSTFAKMTQGTKDFFGKTTQVLMPWRGKPKHGKSTLDKTKSFFTSWLPKKEKKPPQTIPEFLGRPRPY